MAFVGDTHIGYLRFLMKGGNRSRVARERLTLELRNFTEKIVQFLMRRELVFRGERWNKIPRPPERCSGTYIETRNRKMKKQSNIIRLILMAMMIALGVVISPILRVEGMCPMAHFINVTCAVLLGPWEALICAIIIGIIRMLVMGIPPLALTGAIFGAFFSGLLYRLSKGKLLAAVLGEVFGTGIIGAIISYPVMTFIWGREGLTWFFYVPSFIAGTLIGGSIAFAFLRKLAQSGLLERFQNQLGSKAYASRSTLIGNGIAIASIGVIGYVVINIVSGMFKLESAVLTYISRGMILVFMLIAIVYLGVNKFKKSAENNVS